MIIVHGKILSWKSLHGLQGHFQSTQFAVPSVCKFKLCCAKKKQCVNMEKWKTDKSKISWNKKYDKEDPWMLSSCNTEKRDNIPPPKNVQQLVSCVPRDLQIIVKRRGDTPQWSKRHCPNIFLDRWLLSNIKLANTFLKMLSKLFFYCE